MALWKPFLGTRAALGTVEKHAGYVYWCADDGSLHFDYTDADGVLQRKQINAKDCETIMGVSLEELKAQIATQDAVILHEAQTYTDAALEMATNQDAVVLYEAQSYTDSHINDAITRLEILEKIINNSPLVDDFDGVGTLDAGTIMDTVPSDISIVDPGTII